MHYEAELICHPWVPSLAAWRFVVYLVREGVREPVATGAAYYGRDHALEGAIGAAMHHEQGWFFVGRPQLGGGPHRETVKLDVPVRFAP